METGGARKARAGHGAVIDDGADALDELRRHAAQISHHDVIANPNITLRGVGGSVGTEHRASVAQRLVTFGVEQREQ
ncbi:MAG: hypothetical protein ACT6Q3_06910, partial [Sphingopyxis sp.]